MINNDESTVLAWKPTNLRLWRTIVEVAKTWPGFEKYAKQIEDVSDPFAEANAAVSIDDSDFQVMCHGDLWITNVMFKYENVESKTIPTDVRLIDFQYPFVSTPAIDLIFFIVMSAKQEIKVKQFDNIVNEYHTELVKSLAHLRFDGNTPSIDELQQDISKRAFYGKFL